MKNFMQRHFVEIETHIKKIENEEKDRLKSIKIILRFLDGKLQEIKDFILCYEFKSDEEEILFFKELKPQIAGKLIYYMSVFKIEINRPKGGTYAIETYLLAELDKLKHYFSSNIDLYHYYRTKCTQLDRMYFLRNRSVETPVNIAYFYYEMDVRFSTGYDYKISKIIAIDLIELYINTEIVKLKNMKNTDNADITTLSTRETWTASKTDIAELIYALDTSNCFNYGNIKINALTSYFENVFNIKIGDIYRIYLEIRERKGSRTQFLDRLKDNLIKRMDEVDSYEKLEQN